jgi:hypothetical protein
MVFSGGLKPGKLGWIDGLMDLAAHLAGFQLESHNF